MSKFKKAKLPNSVYKNNNYLKVTYSGISKLLYYFNHKLLDLNIPEFYNEHIIEIGGGAEQHLKYMKSKKIKSYTVVDSKIFKNKVLNLNKKYQNIEVKFLDYKKINVLDNKLKYSRLIASHSFEHFENFENNFLKLMPMMKKKSILSIGLPCDPGISWRFLQFISYFNQKRLYEWGSLREKDLDDARDHVISAQNILKIIRFYFFKIKKIYFPFLIPIIEINIFLILQVKMRHFYKK